MISLSFVGFSSAGYADVGRFWHCSSFFFLHKWVECFRELSFIEEKTFAEKVCDSGARGSSSVIYCII